MSGAPQPFRMVAVQPVGFATPQGPRALGRIVATEDGRHFEWSIQRDNLFDPAKLSGGRRHPLARLGPGMLAHEAFLRAVRGHGAERIVLLLGSARLETTVATSLGQGIPADLGAGAGPQLHLPLRLFEGGDAVQRRLDAVCATQLPLPLGPALGRATAGGR